MPQSTGSAALSHRYGVTETRFLIGSKAKGHGCLRLRSPHQGSRAASGLSGGQAAGPVHLLICRALKHWTAHPNSSVKGMSPLTLINRRGHLGLRSGEKAQRLVGKSRMPAYIDDHLTCLKLSAAQLRALPMYISTSHRIGTLPRST